MKRQRKIIHVHLFSGHKNYYFGSITSLFRNLTEEEIGVKESYLRHYLTHDGNHYINEKALILRSVIR